MGHRTISLNDICDGILKEWKKDPDFNFSAWIAAQMMKEYGQGQAKLTDKKFIPLNERGMPTLSYSCPNCKVSGHHWERHCPFPTKEQMMAKLRARAGEEE